MKNNELSLCIVLIFTAFAQFAVLLSTESLISRVERASGGGVVVRTEAVPFQRK